MVSERERRMAVLGPHLFDGVPLARAAADAGVPRRTAQRWLLEYTAEGSTERSGRSDRKPPARCSWSALDLAT
ncbi:MAG: helix-turn-helix domain-containing protein [Actinomycetota bacterium]|nr:helix-turn-helix domain-containing protein [Actinomycetota bacterium]